MLIKSLILSKSAEFLKTITNGNTINLMEIYKDLTSPASKEFEKLLNSQLSKVDIEEGKIINGKINKIIYKKIIFNGNLQRFIKSSHKRIRKTT